MPYFTKGRPRASVRHVLRAESGVGMVSRLNEEALARQSLEAQATDSFDVFLSHFHQDAKLVLGAARLLEDRFLKVYVDWVVNRERFGAATTPAHARMVRALMRQSCSLLYLCTANLIGSR